MTHDENYKSDTSNYSKTPNPIDSHDKLLAKIKDSFYVCGDDCQFCRKDNASWFALRAVVELCTENTDHHLVDKNWVLNAITKELK